MRPSVILALWATHVGLGAAKHKHKNELYRALGDDTRSRSTQCSTLTRTYLTTLMTTLVTTTTSREQDGQPEIGTAIPVKYGSPASRGYTDRHGHGHGIFEGSTTPVDLYPSRHFAPSRHGGTHGVNPPHTISNGGDAGYLSTTVITSVVSTERYGVETTLTLTLTSMVNSGALTVPTSS
ncbi:hypothetical protein BJ166DRAFT_619544, partial [Pestalotiopsis sp. NC0098]